MQLVCQNINIIEKIIETPKGLFLARFAVVNSAGNIKWKLLGVTEYNQKNNNNNNSLKKEILLLEFKNKNNFPKIVESKVSKIISPFVELFFFTSQPTRAPNLI